MNCPNCGRPLAEGEICNCINENAAASVQPDIQPENQQAAPVEPQQNYYTPVMPQFF